MAENKGLTSRSLSALPLLLMGVTICPFLLAVHVFHRAHIMYAWYAVAILLRGGLPSFRRWSKTMSTTVPKP